MRIFVGNKNPTLRARISPVVATWSSGYPEFSQPSALLSQSFKKNWKEYLNGYTK